MNRFVQLEVGITVVFPNICFSNVFFTDEYILVGQGKLQGTHKSFAFCYMNVIDGAALLWFHSTLVNISCFKITVHILQRAKFVSTYRINVELHR